MTEKSYQDAVQILKQRLGGRWNGVERDGRDEMARILQSELGYDNQTADDAIEAMIESGTLRYRRGGDNTDDVMPLPFIPAGAGGSNIGAGSGGMMAAPAAAANLGGYWEIGPTTDDMPGRAGQVDPTA